MAIEPRSREPVDPSRVRKIPRYFAWADPRLRERLGELTLPEIALLFFLHLAADRQGCSFWSEATVGKRLGLREEEVIRAREGLRRQGLLAYRFPLFQILPLQDVSFRHGCACRCSGPPGGRAGRL